MCVHVCVLFCGGGGGGGGCNAKHKIKKNMRNPVQISSSICK